jgi:hypothetical protein
VHELFAQNSHFGQLILMKILAICDKIGTKKKDSDGRKTPIGKDGRFRIKRQKKEFRDS